MKKLGILVVAAAFGLTGCVGQAPAPSPTGSGAPTDTSTYKQWKSWTTVADYEKQAGKTVPAYVDPPALAAKVTSGALPPAASRIPKDAQVVAGPDGVGQSGGTLQAGSLGGSDLLFEYPFSYNADQKTTSPNIIKSDEVNSTLTEYTMHLRDGGCRDRRPEFDEQRLDRRTELRRDLGLGFLHAERRHPVLEAGKISGVVRADEVGAGCEELPELDVGGAELAHRHAEPGALGGSAAAGHHAGQPQRQPGRDRHVGRVDSREHALTGQHEGSPGQAADMPQAGQHRG